MSVEVMTEILSGQEISQLCKTLKNDEPESFLTKQLQELIKDYPVRLASRGDEWYRIGGVIDQTGNRVAKDVIEWAERSYIESGHNIQALIDFALDEQLIATRQIGQTLYFVVETGQKAEEFTLLEIDKTHEVSDRMLVNEDVLPEDMEDFIDPLHPAKIERKVISKGHRFRYRRKTDMASFLEAFHKHQAEEHPVRRFINDWNRSSAYVSGHVFCRDWLIRPFQHTGRYGETVVNAEIISLQTKQLPYLGELAGKHGRSLNKILLQFDHQAGYPFAWYFYMLKGKLVSPHNGEAVFEDITGDFAYLPARDEAILKDWIAAPYYI